MNIKVKYNKIKLANLLIVFKNWRYLYFLRKMNNINSKITKKVDEKLKQATIDLGMNYDSISRLALIEYLQNHFQINIRTEVHPAKNETPVSQRLSQDV